MRLMAIVPAHNEAASLPVVIAGLREHLSDDAILVVDDGSSDSSWQVARDMGVAWLHCHQQLGLGGALRAGLRRAHELGHDLVVRLDADGQHPAAEIEALVRPITKGQADAVVGSRFLRPSGYQQPLLRRLMGQTLARCLSLLSGQLVTDPTSGFWAFGPRAVSLLAGCYPTGYSEPELLLLLRRNRLHLIEVPVTMHQRHSGHSSLTSFRAAQALARAFLAMMVVPLRAQVREIGQEPSHD